MTLRAYVFYEMMASLFLVWLFLEQATTLLKSPEKQPPIIYHCNTIWWLDFYEISSSFESGLVVNLRNGMQYVYLHLPPRNCFGYFQLNLCE